MNVQCLYVFIDLALLEWIKVKAWLVKAIFVLIFLTVPALRTISVWALQFGMCFEWSKHMCIDQSNLDITVWDGNGMRFQNIGLINLFLWYCCLIFSLLDAQTAFFIIWELRGTLSNTSVWTTKTEANSWRLYDALKFLMINPSIEPGD